MNKQFQGTLFDGISAKGQDVQLTFTTSNQIIIHHEAENITLNKQDYQLEFPVGKTNLIINQTNNQSIHIPYDQELIKALKKSNGSKFTSIISVLENHLGLCLSLLGLTIVFIILSYLYALPLGVKITQPLIPETTKTFLGTNILKAIDSSYMEKSYLLPQTQQKIALTFDELAQNVPLQTKPDLQFKFSETFGANAFAILPNHVILLDDLVKLMEEDEVEAVLAHELGHLYYDHTTEALLRYSFVTAFTAMVIGVEPGTMQLLATSLLENGNSREHEMEADRFAVELLHKLGKDPLKLVSGLNRMKADFGEESFFKYLSTHPTSKEREKYITEHAESLQ